MTMTITSSAFDHNGTLPSKYTCDGQNVSPPLTISGVPSGTKSIALVVDDPDAPMGTFTHWIAWNIDPIHADIPEAGAPPGAVQGCNSADTTGYIGACPPSGTHRYFFRAFALSGFLDLDASADREKLRAAMEGKVLGQAELMGTYVRK